MHANFDSQEHSRFMTPIRITNINLSSVVATARSWVRVLLSAKLLGSALEQGTYLKLLLGRLTVSDITGAACKCEWLALDQLNALQAMTLGLIFIVMSSLLKGPLRLQKWSYQSILTVSQGKPLQKCRNKQTNKQDQRA